MQILLIAASLSRDIFPAQIDFMNFRDLRLDAALLDALAAEGYTLPTPIQQKAIPVVLEGKDIIACAQTGTGKTAAFALPILQLLKGQNSKTIKCLILTPTRELAIQIGDCFAAYGKNLSLRTTVIFGGVPQGAQVKALQAGTDILVATPGRLLDLLQQKIVRLDQIGIFVLDEADRMLDMGFIHDVKRLIKVLPQQRQTLLFSATMPAEVEQLATTMMREPVAVSVTPVSSAATTVQQFVYHVEKKDKRALLTHVLKEEKDIRNVIVFTRTKHGADKLAKALCRENVGAEAIHGDKSQGARQRALGNFKSGSTRVLVATDIAARGIDIDALSHVINFDLPEVAETYVHRIGRTGRAGADGIAWSFCDPEEVDYLKGIQKLTGRQLSVVDVHPYRADGAAPLIRLPKNKEVVIPAGAIAVHPSAATRRTGGSWRQGSRKR